jgi:hypothetical protein
LDSDELDHVFVVLRLKNGAAMAMHAGSFDVYSLKAFTEKRLDDLVTQFEESLGGVTKIDDEGEETTQ